MERVQLIQVRLGNLLAERSHLHVLLRRDLNELERIEWVEPG